MSRVGDRVELVACDDPYTRLRPGERGTVTLIDSLGTVHVRWDSGAQLGLVPDHDVWKEVTPWKQIRRWFSRSCVSCGRRKPLLTAYCDECWIHHPWNAHLV